MALGELTELELEALAIMGVERAHDLEFVPRQALVALAACLRRHLRLRVAYRTFP